MISLLKQQIKHKTKPKDTLNKIFNKPLSFKKGIPKLIIAEINALNTIKCLFTLTFKTEAENKKITNVIKKLSNKRISI